MPKAGMYVETRFSEMGRAMVEAALVETDASATRIEQDVKGGPHSLYQAYPEKPSYKRTGNLGRSYHKTDAKLKAGTVVAEVGNDPDVADYVVHVEYGTVKMEAEPHLRPSVDAERPLYEAGLRAAMAAAVKKVEFAQRVRADYGVKL